MKSIWFCCYYAGVTVSALVLVPLRHDWTWFLVAAITGATWFVHSCDFLNALPRGEGLLRYCPAWMATRWGQRLATRVPFFGGRWKRNMDEAAIKDADVDAAMWGIRLQIAMNCFVNSNNDPSEMAQVMAMWCAWRSSAERAHRYRERQAGKRLDLPPWLAGMPRMEEVFENVH